MGYMKRRDLERRIEEMESVVSRLSGRINQLERERDARVESDHYHTLTEAELECINAVFGD